ncbi:MAG: hypothetical protein ACK4L4_03375 [Gemmobacter sp.]
MTLFFALLAAQTVLGLVWAYAAFRILFRLRARAMDDSGQAFPGLSASLRAVHGFLTRPADRRDRLRFGLLTFFLIVVTGGIAILGAAR